MYDNNSRGGCYDNGCSSCGIDYCGCSYSGGYDCGSTGFNPINQTSNINPDIQGSTGTGGNGTSTSAGGSANGNCVTLNIPTYNNKYMSCPCIDGITKLISYLYDRSLDEDIKTESMCIYGDTVPDTIGTSCVCSPSVSMLSLETPEEICNISLSEGIIKSENIIVSLCSIDAIVFKFEGSVNQDTELKKMFRYYNVSNSCCNYSYCSNGMDNALLVSGFSNNYNVRLDGVFIKSGDNIDRVARLDDVSLIAFDNNIAIFSGDDPDNRCYTAIPICSISKLEIVAN